MSRRSSITLDGTWHHLLEVINVPAAHPVRHGTPELPDAFIQLRHVSGLVLVFRKFFIEPHTFSIEFKSGLLAGLFHQLILFFSLKV